MGSHLNDANGNISSKSIERTVNWLRNYADALDTYAQYSFNNETDTTKWEEVYAKLQNMGVYEAGACAHALRGYANLIAGLI